MLRLSKVCVRSIPIGLTLVALALAGCIMSLQAAPVCNMGTLVELPPGGAVPFSNLSPGHCVQIGDTLFGNFDFGNIPAFGSVTFAEAAANHVSATIISGFVQGTMYDPRYEVEATGTASITEVLADVTQSIGGATTLVQTTTPAPSSGEINLTKEGNTVTGPNQLFFTPGVADLEVASTFIPGPGSDASAILNTILETPVATPEPAALVLLGITLTGFGAFALRRRSR